MPLHSLLPYLSVNLEILIWCLFKQNVASADASKNKAAYGREGRKQLFAVLQSARGSSGDCFYFIQIQG